MKSVQTYPFKIGFFLFLCMIFTNGCSSLMLKPADFAWPIEDEPTIDSNGMVQEARYSLSFSVKPLFYAEMKDSTNVSGKTIRIIRDGRGFYFITAPKFKNVYVFSHADGGLVVEKTIEVSKDGLSSPAFNQRTPYVQLINGKDKPILLTRDGIKAEESHPAEEGKK